MDEIVVNFHWLIELFAPEGEKSLRHYVKSVRDPLTVETTQEADQAQRFVKPEAEKLAAALLNKLGVWRAAEHGFVEVPQ